ncbi:hypothetical protein EVAR_27709_1 [Eumeta japonica]|uniref:Uncharacterized protein n=1 Tax=Eumeta variegata TaxID=151549 RepID=A0A4C1WMS5_EUMVA|nr:hypothetical protein EVAR_27709_1 [Eumeta japonica]
MFIKKNNKQRILETYRSYLAKSAVARARVWISAGAGGGAARPPPKSTRNEFFPALASNCIFEEQTSLRTTIQQVVISHRPCALSSHPRKITSTLPVSWAGTGHLIEEDCVDGIWKRERTPLLSGGASRRAPADVDFNSEIATNAERFHEQRPNVDVLHAELTADTT